VYIVPWRYKLIEKISGKRDLGIMREKRRAGHKLLSCVNDSKNIVGSMLEEAQSQKHTGRK